MHYTHFGKPADVFKHLNLCMILTEVLPEVYVETNSAYASYTLYNTQEQQYGVYHFIEKGKSELPLQTSVYYTQENEAMENHIYLGSPALAMNILKKTAQQFFFFDVEALALADVVSFATANGLSSKVKTLCQDSIQGTMNLLSSIPGTSLLHIDPYQIDQPGKEGYTYLDVFVKATEVGMKCVLWYGFNTLNEKRKLNDYIRQSLSHSKGNNFYCVEWIMNRIQQNTISDNPGILGNGLLTSNLSEETNRHISEYTYLLEKIYQGICYKDLDGGYYKEEISL